MGWRRGPRDGFDERPSGQLSVHSVQLTGNKSSVSKFRRNLDSPRCDPAFMPQRGPALREQREQLGLFSAVYRLFRRLICPSRLSARSMKYLRPRPSVAIAATILLAFDQPLRSAGSINWQTLPWHRWRGIGQFCCVTPRAPMCASAQELGQAGCPRHRTSSDEARSF